MTDNLTVPAPISFQPSNYWDGNDGAWSSFAVQIGSPPQAVRLLPSITGNAIWTVWDYACEGSDLLNCPGSRGNVFNITGSSTWETEGNYSLPLNPEHYLPYYGGAVVGFDNITLDWQDHGGKALDKQLIDVYVTNDFYIGSFGLSPETINISSFNDQVPSVVRSLRQENLIPSASWGYLAGASYRTYPYSGFGSLTLGGYDLSRLRKNSNLTLAGGSDAYRPFLLGIEKITTGEVELLEEPIITALDSLISQLWLPISACQAFETAFGLVWNETYELYLLDTDQHSALVTQNASITFGLSTGISDSTDRLNITLPYAAFDLKASPPLTSNETYFYFPLKRAANDTQYTLGRTIMQEIYMLADYERGHITLYEAIYPETSVQSKIITICPVNSTICISETQASTPKSRKLAAGATAGIVIGAIVVLLAVGAFIWIKCFRNKRRDAASTAGTGTGTETTEARHSTGTFGLGDKSELDGKALGSPRSELEGHFKPGATPSMRDSGYTSAQTPTHSSSSPGVSPSVDRHSRVGVSEAGGRPLQELSGQTSQDPSELCGNPVRHELPG